VTVTIDVLVQPRASRAKIGPRHDGRIKIAVTAPPVDGEANAAVANASASIDLLAKSLGVAKSAVAVVAGASSRRKTPASRKASQSPWGTIAIEGVTAAQIEELLG
jgi:uncharacterized protein YggU (UPF0235/DUF167 family)